MKIDQRITVMRCEVPHALQEAVEAPFNIGSRNQARVPGLESHRSRRVPALGPRSDSHLVPLAPQPDRRPCVAAPDRGQVVRGEPFGSHPSGGLRLMKDPPPIVKNPEGQLGWRSVQKSILAIARDPEKLGQKLPVGLNSNLADVGCRRSIKVLHYDLQPRHRSGTHTSSCTLARQTDPHCFQKCEPPRHSATASRGRPAGSGMGTSPRVGARLARRLSGRGGFRPVVLASPIPNGLPEPSGD